MNKKLNLKNFNWYGFDHQLVNKKFEGELTYVGTFCVLGGYYPFAWYKSKNPNKRKGHKKYMGLAKHGEEGVVTGISQIQMNKEKIQSGLRCKKCNDIIYSVMRHDYRPCKCDSVAIDGGKDYAHVKGTDSMYTPVTIDLLKGEVIDE